MKRIASMALAAATLCVASGCGNRIVGHQLERSSQFYVELGVTGHLNEVAVLDGSRVTKLSLFGSANVIDVADDVTLGKIEVWGNNNRVTIPDNLFVRVSEVGKGNQIIRRPSANVASSTERPRPAAAAQKPTKPDAPDKAPEKTPGSNP